MATNQFNADIYSSEGGGAAQPSAPPGDAAPSYQTAPPGGAVQPAQNAPPQQVVYVQQGQPVQYVQGQQPVQYVQGQPPQGQQVQYVQYVQQGQGQPQTVVVAAQPTPQKVVVATRPTRRVSQELFCPKCNCVCPYSICTAHATDHQTMMCVCCRLEELRFIT